MTGDGTKERMLAKRADKGVGSGDDNENKAFALITRQEVRQIFSDNEKRNHELETSIK